MPRGWEVLRLALPETPAGPGPDDLLALVNAVREAANYPADEALAAPRTPKGALEPPADTGAIRRGHLRILRE